jgi:hypothetical protein
MTGAAQQQPQLDPSRAHRYIVDDDHLIITPASPALVQRRAEAPASAEPAPARPVMRRRKALARAVSDARLCERRPSVA